LTFTPAQFLTAFAVWTIAGTAVWFHAERNHIKHASAWASLVFLVTPIGLLAYFIYVRRIRRRRRAGGV
jgi:uncharacterized membrane protein